MAKLRLDKMLSNMGVGSRKEVKLLIRWGRVTIDGERAGSGWDYVDTDKNEVAVDGEILNFKPMIYLMLNKPQGYVSATEDYKENTVLELVPEEYAHYELFPMGRLDKDTVGLLVLSNDGKLAHEVLSPKKHVPKTYYAQIAGVADETTAKAFKEGVVLDDGYKTLPAELKVLSTDVDAGTSEIELVIHEGKFHQVKRMFESVGMTVTFLKRTRMGKLNLDESLELGEIRELTEAEVALMVMLSDEGMDDGMDEGMDEEE